MAGGHGTDPWVDSSLDTVIADLASVPEAWAPHLLPVLKAPDDRPGWLSMAELALEASTLQPHLRATANGRRLPPDRQLIGSTFVLVNAQFMHNVLALALLNRPVLRLHPKRTHVLIANPANHVDCHAGNTLAVAIKAPIQVSAPGHDPANAARDTIAEHGTAIVDAVHELTRTTRRTGWALLAGVLSERLLALGRATGNEHAAAKLLDRIIDPGSPLGLAPPRRHLVKVDGIDHHWSCRAVCCLNYKAYSHCTAYCPLVNETDRAAAAVELLRMRTG